MTLATLSTWHELVRTQNTKGLSSVLADEVVFYSPIVNTPQVGKAAEIMESDRGIACVTICTSYSVLPAAWQPSSDGSS